MSDKVIASSTQKIEIVTNAAKAHEFFSQLESTLLEFAGRPNAEQLPITIYIKLYSTSDEEPNGGLEITVDDKGEKQLARLDFK